MTASDYGLFFGDRCIQFLFEAKLGVSTEAIENTLSSEVARPEGFEPPTLCLEGRRSFQLSYGRWIDSKRFPARETIICYVPAPYCARTVPEFLHSETGRATKSGISFAWRLSLDDAGHADRRTLYSRAHRIVLEPFSWFLGSLHHARYCAAAARRFFTSISIPSK